MLRYRLITGFLLFMLLFGAIWLDANCAWLHCATCPDGVLIAAIAACFAFVGGMEMTRLLETRQAGETLSPIAGGLGAAAMTVSTWLVVGSTAAEPVVPAGLLVVVPMAAVLLAFALTAASRSCSPSIGHAAAAALSTVWVGGGLGIIAAVYALAGWQMLLLIVLVTKLADTGAYAVGCSIGRHKLIPWVSPGKTWEGLAGGMVFAAVTTIVFFECFTIDNPEMHDNVVSRLLIEVSFGVLLALGGLIGDLTVSMLKRDAGVKDSGGVLPGMGGVLDMVDSLLITAPLAWVIMQIFH